MATPLGARGLCCALLCLLGVWAGGASGRIWIVDKPGDQHPNSTKPCATPSGCDLRSAVFAARNGDVVSIKVPNVFLRATVLLNASAVGHGNGSFAIEGGLGLGGVNIRQNGTGYSAFSFYNLYPKLSTSVTLKNLQFSDWVVGGKGYLEEGWVVCLSVSVVCAPGEAAKLKHPQPRTDGRDLIQGDLPVFNMQDIWFVNNTILALELELTSVGVFFGYSAGFTLPAVMNNVRFSHNILDYKSATYSGVYGSMMYMGGDGSIVPTITNAVFEHSVMGVSLAPVLFLGGGGSVSNSQFHTNLLSVSDSLVTTPSNPQYGYWQMLNMTNVSIVRNTPYMGKSYYDSGPIAAGIFNLADVRLEASKNMSFVVATETSYFSDCDFYISPSNPAKVVRFIRGSANDYKRTIYNRNPKTTNLVISQGVFADCKMAAKSALSCAAGETCTDLHYDGNVVGYRCD